jgi:hypothetical protein
MGTAENYYLCCCWFCNPFSKEWDSSIYLFIYLFLDTRGTLQKKVSYSSGVTIIQVKGKNKIVQI